MLRVRLLLKRDQFSAAEELLPVALRRFGPARDRGPRDARQPVQDPGAISREPSGWSATGPTSIPTRSDYRELAQLGSINPHKLDLVRDGLDKAARTLPTTTGSGWAGPTWRRGPGDMRRRRDGSTAAGGADRTIRRSAGPARAGDGDGRRGRVAGRPAPPAGSAVEPAEVLELGDGSRSPPATPIERALWRLLERSPDHLRAMERLAELLLAGRAEGATRLRGARRSSTGQGATRCCCSGPMPASRRGDRPPSRGAGPSAGGPHPLDDGVGGARRPRGG